MSSDTIAATAVKGGFPLPPTPRNHSLSIPPLQLGLPYYANWITLGTPMYSPATQAYMISLDASARRQSQQLNAQQPSTASCFFPDQSPRFPASSQPRLRQRPFKNDLRNEKGQSPHQASPHSAGERNENVPEKTKKHQETSPRSGGTQSEPPKHEETLQEAEPSDKDCWPVVPSALDVAHRSAILWNLWNPYPIQTYHLVPAQTFLPVPPSLFSPSLYVPTSGAAQSSGQNTGPSSTLQPDDPTKLARLATLTTCSATLRSPLESLYSPCQKSSAEAPAPELSQPECIAERDEVCDASPTEQEINVPTLAQPPREIPRRNAPKAKRKSSIRKSRSRASKEDKRETISGKRPKGMQGKVRTSMNEILNEALLKEGLMVEDDGRGGFKCSKCDATFVQRNICQRHILSHMSYKAFECQWCHKTFVRYDSLARHVTNRCPLARSHDVIDASGYTGPIETKCLPHRKGSNHDWADPESAVTTDGQAEIKAEIE